MQPNTNYIIGFTKLIKNHKRACAEALAAYSFSPGETDVLMFLTNNPYYDTAKDISEFKGISKSLVCRSVDSLVKKGYLNVETDTKDRRCIHLKLNSKAIPAAEVLQKQRADYIKQLFSGISEEEIQLFESVLSRMLANSLTDV